MESSRQTTYQKAYDAAKAKLIGNKGGQGQEYMIGCNSTKTWVVKAGRSTTCGVSDVWFADRFADELCSQAGIECSGYDPAGSIEGAGLGSDGLGYRIGGGPEAKGGLGSRNTPGCFRSFSGETLVEMGDGSRKPISLVKVGDKVLATDPETGERGPRTVTHLWIHKDTLLELEVEGGVLTTTEDHPFWNATDGKFERADQLDPGDQLLSDNGQQVRVIGLRPGSERVATAYNLTVNDIHTYYVVAGDTPILVHNVSCRTFGFADAPTVPGVYSITMKDGKVYVGSSAVDVHSRLHAAFTDKTSAIMKAGYTRNDVANIGINDMSGHSWPAIRGQEQSVMDSYGGLGGGVLLNRRNEVGW